MLVPKFRFRIVSLRRSWGLQDTSPAYSDMLPRRTNPTSGLKLGWTVLYSVEIFSSSSRHAAWNAPGLVPVGSARCVAAKQVRVDLDLVVKLQVHVRSVDPVVVAGDRRLAVGDDRADVRRAQEIALDAADQVVVRRRRPGAVRSSSPARRRRSRRPAPTRAPPPTIGIGVPAALRPIRRLKNGTRLRVVAVPARARRTRSCRSSRERSRASRERTG